PFLEDMSYQQVSHEDIYQFWQEQEPPEEDDEERDVWPEISLHLRKMLATGMGGSSCQLSYPGSMGTGKETDQLVREAQYRVFNPVMKGLNPNLDNTGALGQNIQLRQKFLPYNYTLAWENSQKGFPLARPMYMHYSEDPQTRNIDRQFLWGESILVSPVFNPDPEEKKVYFPAGKWFDFFTSRIYVGGGWRNVQVASGHLPVFVKEGSFLPLLPDTVSNFDGRQFEIRYFPDYQGDITSGKMYLDNGKESQAFKNGNYLLVELNGRVDKKGIFVNLNTSGFGFPEIPERHQINLAVMDLKSSPKKIFINGKKIQMLSSGEFDANTEIPEAYGVYIPGRNQLDIFWIWDQLPGEIVIKGKFK
ncbi:MAG: hypothetical protein KDE26_25385, partial [Bacteroidetes bacterium]|nr:hypothetical protein [Bacteroidota bacterium]